MLVVCRCEAEVAGSGPFPGLRSENSATAAAVTARSADRAARNILPDRTLCLCSSGPRSIYLPCSSDHRSGRPCNDRLGNGHLCCSGHPCSNRGHSRAAAGAPAGSPCRGARPCSAVAVGALAGRSAGHRPSASSRPACALCRGGNRRRGSAGGPPW